MPERDAEAQVERALTSSVAKRARAGQLAS
jgi:hypothetical protein